MSEPQPPGHPGAVDTWHLSAELLRRFLAERVSAPERQRVVRHLLTRCPDCFALAERITAEAGYWTGKGGADERADRDYTAAFQSAFRFATQGARRLAVERLRGWAHWSALDPLLPQERLAAVITQRDWHHWRLFQALLDAAHWYSSRDPHEAAEIAALALDVADLLDPVAVGGEAAANDMRARAWVLLADCRRLAVDFEGARAAIAEAWKWNEEGAGDPLDRARIYVSEAAYAGTVGEFETATVILEKALSLYRGAADPHSRDGPWSRWRA
jgi:tetratricopeptide (TPR) repeat protein